MLRQSTVEIQKLAHGLTQNVVNLVCSTKYMHTGTETAFEWAKCAPSQQVLALICFEFLQYTCALVALDRLFAVRSPLHVAQWETKRKAMLGLILVGMFSVLFNFPTFIELKYIPNVGITQSDLRQNDVYRILYRSGASLVLMFLLPFVLLAGTNVVLLFSLRLQSKWNADGNICRKHTAIPGKAITESRQMTVKIWNLPF